MADDKLQDPKLTDAVPGKDGNTDNSESGPSSAATAPQPPLEADAMPEQDPKPEAVAKSEAEAAPETNPEAEAEAAPETSPGVKADETPKPKPEPEPVNEEERQALIDALQANQELFSSLTDPLSDEAINRILELASTLPDLLLQVSKSKTAGLEENLLATARLVKAVKLAQQHGEQIVELTAAADKLGFKNTNQLVSLRKLSRQFKSEIGWPQEAPKTAAFNKLLETEKKLDELAEKNQQYQEQLLTATRELADSLGKALEEGNSAEASALWDKIQSNITNLSGRAQHDFKLQTAEFRNQVNELRDWKKFAATEKKKELIGQMEQLLAAEMNPPDRARQINKLHDEWKRLGYSNQNEKLWQQFKKTSDEAYAPCKEYFKQQKGAMAENLRQRTEICTQLETFLENLDRDAIQLVELKKIEDQARDDWKKYAPVEQSKIKKLQKRFYALLNQLKEIRNDAARKNGELKQQLVEKAKGLLDSEDRREAMNLARALQEEWKTIGPSFYKDDRKYWDSFRAACDALFKERDAVRKAVKSDIAIALKACNDILQKLETVFAQEEEAFRESRGQFASLQRDFNQALGGKIKKERQQLLNSFTALTRKIEGRYRKLPDKKQLQQLAALEGRAALCLELEQKILAGKDDEALQQAVATADRDAWQSLANSGNAELDKLMEARWKSLLGLNSISNLNKLLSETERQAREQVIQAEINASLDSPDQDKSLRMELQLSQLQSNFGKASTDSAKSRERDARQFQLQFLCLGPLSTQVRAELEQRVSRILEKLF